MSIEAIKFGLNSIQPITQQQPKVEGDAKSNKGGGFGEVLTQVMKDVNSMQLEADQQIENVLTGKNGNNIHDAMVALEKADMAFQFMTTLQQKILKAYEEVVKTQI